MGNTFTRRLILCGVFWLMLGVGTTSAEPIRPVDAKLLKNLKDPSTALKDSKNVELGSNDTGKTTLQPGGDGIRTANVTLGDPDGERIEPVLEPTEARKIRDRKTGKTTRTRKAQVGVQLSSLQAVGLLLLALIACVAGGVFFRRRLKERKGAKDIGRLMSLKETLWLGKGQRLLLVHVAGRDVLLSVTSQGIQTLVTFPGGDRASPETDSATKRAEDFFPSMVEEEMAAPVERQTVERGRVPSNERVKQILRRLNTL